MRYDIFTHFGSYLWQKCSDICENFVTDISIDKWIPHSVKFLYRGHRVKVTEAKKACLSVLFAPGLLLIETQSCNHYYWWITDQVDELTMTMFQIVLYREKDVLSCICEMPFVHSLLSKIPDDLPFELLITQAGDLFIQYPPNMLEHEAKIQYERWESLVVKPVIWTEHNFHAWVYSVIEAPHNFRIFASQTRTNITNNNAINNICDPLFSWMHQDWKICKVKGMQRILYFYFTKKT